MLKTSIINKYLAVEFIKIVFNMVLIFFCLGFVMNLFDEQGSSSILDLVGNTPLLQVSSLTRDLPDVEIYAKAEYFNPGGSVKDRPALSMILEGERSGRLSPDKVLLDSTSGNTGIAYAMISAVQLVWSAIGGVTAWPPSATSRSGKIALPSICPPQVPRSIPRMTVSVRLNHTTAFTWIVVNPRVRSIANSPTCSRVSM